MRIFEINTYCGVGSTGRIAVDIAEYASIQGAETIIGFGAGEAPAEAAVYALRIGSRLGRKWHGALRKLLDAEGYGSTHATKRLIAFLDEWKPDVVHLHNLHGCYINHRLLFHYLRSSNLPVVWTLHDCWPFTGHCAYFDFVCCERWKTGCGKCPQKRSYPTCVGPDGSARNYRRRRQLFTGLSKLTLVTPCEWLKEKLAQSFLSGIPARVIYNGVNRDVFYPRESRLPMDNGINGQRIVLAVASEWEERKGLRYLPALAKRLGEAYRMVIIGLSAEQIASLPTGIHGIEKTANARELAKWYTAAACLANPTLEDNMPMVNLEALACGTPVVTFRTGGCPEAVDETCGAVVEKGDEESFAQAVRHVAENREALRDGCLKRAADFDKTICTKAYWDLYQEVCR